MPRARVLLLVAMVGAAGCATGARVGVVRIDHAELLVSAATTPPSDATSGWRPQSLPDVWTAERRRQGTEGWYRATVHLERAPEGLWAISLRRAGQNAAVWVNGQLVGDGGRFTEPVARNWNRPLLFTVPAGLLHAGDNHLLVRLKCNPTAPGYLGVLEMGPEPVLRPQHETQFRRQVTLAEVATGATLVTALLIGVVYLRRDTTGAYRWFAAGALCWTLTALDGVIRDIPVPTAVWEWATNVALNAFVPCFVMAFHRAFDIRRPRLEWALALYVVGGAATLLLVEPVRRFAVTMAWAVGTVGLAAYLVVLLAGAPQRRTRVGVLLVPAIVGVAFGAHDMIWVVTGTTLAGTLLFPFIAPIAMIFSGWNILGHLAAGLTESELLNRDLEQRVADKHAELEANWERLRELERERAIAGERERIMRDMHDGMGGQLVSTLAMVESGRFTSQALADALRDALDDLRLVIDSLDPVEEDLLAVLAVIRARLEPRLGRHGLRFDWQVADVPAIPGLGPERVLQALRIVQEAITNVVKHAGAHTITVSTGAEPGPDGRDGVFVEVRDDGHGLDGRPGTGRGVANMTRRAAVLGGRLTLTSSETGTSVRLWLPA